MINCISAISVHKKCNKDALLLNTLENPTLARKNVMARELDRDVTLFTQLPILLCSVIYDF